MQYNSKELLVLIVTLGHVYDIKLFLILLFCDVINHYKLALQFIFSFSDI